MNGVIVDDQADARKILERFCEVSEMFSTIKLFDNAIEAFQYLQKHDTDILFLDIHMPGLSGMELLKAMAAPINVIFTTSDKDYAVEAFEHNAIDYIVKPIEYGRFMKALHRASKVIERQQMVGEGSAQQEAAIFVKEGGKLVRLLLEDLYYIEAKGDYVSIHTKERSFLVHSTLKGKAAKLPEHQFIQVHRSFIVNLAHIQDIEEGIIKVGPYKVPLSKNKRDSLLSRLRIV